MADLEPAPDNDGAYSGLTKEACDRIEACEKQKLEFDTDLREAMFFAAPHRAREVRSAQPPSESKPGDGATRNTAIASELSRDCVTEIVNAFMPQAEPWAERRPGMFLPAQVQEEAKKAAAEQDPVIFDAIRASNLYEIIPMAFDPDLTTGTAALWIDDPRPAENIVVQAVPLHELEINLGPFGDIDDRFVVRHTRNRHVEALLGPDIWAKVPEKLKKVIRYKPKDRTIVRWGYWRLWAKRDDIWWQHVVMIGKEVVHSAEINGEGCCPLLVMRFGASPEWAFGTGPLIESLEDLRLLDTLIADLIDHIELSLRPPTGYPSDDFAAVENGIEPGNAYPLRPGAQDAIKPIFEGGDIEGALFETKEIEERLGRRFFVGFPRQEGKTPPTATQWIDEMIEAQRRIGTPGMPFWREGPAQIFLRFKYLLEQRGVIAPIVVDGKTVALTPYNPAQRAAEQQEVAMAARYLSIVAGTFPEEFRIKVDGGETMEAIRDKMRAKLVVFRSPQGQKAAVAQIAQLIEGRQQIRPGDPAVAGNQ